MTVYSPAAPLTQEVGFSAKNVAPGTATTTVQTGPTCFRSVTINTKGASANTLTIYDGTAATGIKIATIDTTAAQVTLTYNVQCLTSLTCVSATGTGADYTVVYW